MTNTQNKPEQINLDKLNGNRYLYEVIATKLDNNHEEIKADLKATLEAFTKLKDTIEHLVTAINTGIDLAKFVAPYVYKFALAILVLLGGLIGVKIF